MKKGSFVVVFLFFLSTSYAVDNIWVGGDLANPIRWDVDANWSLGHVPTSSEDVIIDGTGSYEESPEIVIHNVNDFTINSLLLNVPIAAGGLAFQLEILGSLTIENDLSFGSGSVENNVSLNKTNTFLVKGDVNFSVGNDNGFLIKGVAGDSAIAEFQGTFNDLDAATFSVLNKTNSITFDGVNDQIIPSSSSYGTMIFKGNGKKTILDDTRIKDLYFPDSDQDVVYDTEVAIPIEVPITHDYNKLTFEGIGNKLVNDELTIIDTLIISSVGQPRVRYSGIITQHVINAVYYDISFSDVGKKYVSDSITVLGSFIANDGTEIEYDSDNDQTIFSTDYTKLRFSGAGRKLIGGSADVQVKSTGDFIANNNPVADPTVDTTGFVNISQYSDAVLIVDGSANFEQSTLGFDADVNQTISKDNDVHYCNINISGTGVKNINAAFGVLNVDRSISIEQGAIFNMSNDTILIGKDYITATDQGNITSSSDGVIEFVGGTYDSDIKGDVTFSNLLISKTSKTTTIYDSLTILNAGVVTLQSISDQLVVNSGAALVLDATQAGYAIITEIPTGATIVGNVTAKQYINPSSRTWYQFTNPVSTTAADWKDDFLITGDFKGADELGGSNLPSIYTYEEDAVDSHIDSGWVAFPSDVTDAVELGKGYRVFLRDDIGNVTEKTLEVTGPLNYGQITLPITYDDNGDAGSDGWNFIGNPYPAPIDWAGINKDALGDINAYVWDGNSKDWNNSSTDFSNDQIASFQGFWVQSIAGGGNLVFNESDKSTTSTPLLRTAVQNNIVHLSLFDKNDSQRYNFAKTKIILNPNATDGFDRELERSYLSRNMFNQEGDDNLLDIASVTVEGRRLKENHVPESEESKAVELYTEYSSNKSYLLEIHLENFDMTNELFLYDSFLDEVVEISENTFTYDVELTTNESRKSNRFSLYVGDEVLGIEGSEVVSSMSIYPNPVVKGNTNVRIFNAGDGVNINVFNSMGVLVYSEEYKNNTSTFIKEIVLGDLSKGVYTINVISNSNTLSEKLIVD